MSLRKVREATGKGLREAARDAQVHASQLSEWETGEKVPGTKSLRKLASLYSLELGAPVTVGQLLGDEEFVPPPATPAAS
jgi:transcriptional regulator with XRE-family HTH domain